LHARRIGELMSNVEIVKGVYEAFGRGDVPSVLAAMDPKMCYGQSVSPDA
jgi:ketosteroid isomerase-like protein